MRARTFILFDKNERYAPLWSNLHQSSIGRPPLTSSFPSQVRNRPHGLPRLRPTPRSSPLLPSPCSLRRRRRKASGTAPVVSTEDDDNLALSTTRLSGWLGGVQAAHVTTGLLQGGRAGPFKLQRGGAGGAHAQRDGVSLLSPPALTLGAQISITILRQALSCGLGAR